MINETIDGIRSYVCIADNGLVFYNDEKEVPVTGLSDKEAVRRVVRKYNNLGTDDRTDFKGVVAGEDYSLKEIETILDELDERRQQGRECFIDDFKVLPVEEVMRQLDGCINWAKYGRKDE